MTKADSKPAPNVTFSAPLSEGQGLPPAGVSLLALRGGAADFVEVSPSSSEVEDPLSVDWLVAQPDLPVLAQVIPAARLYRMIQSVGHEEALEVIEWIRGPQLTKVFDFDLWTAVRPASAGAPLSARASFSNESAEDHEGKVAVISAERFLEWSSSWHEIAPEFAAERFVELDEEVMILIARSLFEIVPVGLENGVMITDEFFMSHDRRFHLRFKLSDTEAQERSGQFLSTLYAHELEFAGRVLSYASMLVESEVEEEAIRWRAARMADDGFVERSEALSLLAPRSLEFWNPVTIERLQKGEGAHAATQAVVTREDVVTSGLEPDVVEAVARCLEEISKESETSKALISVDDWAVEAADAAAQALQKVQRLDAMATGMSMGSGEAGEKLLVDDVLQQIGEDDFVRWTGLASRLARQANAVASLLPDPASFHAQKRAAGLLRATLNLGLEWFVDGCPSPREWSRAAARGGLSMEPSRARHELAIEKFTTLGVETVFRAGLDLLHALSLHAANALLEHLRAKPAVETASRIVALVKRQRYGEVASLLWDLQGALSAEWVLLSECVLTRFPAMPMGLDQKGAFTGEHSGSLSPTRKILEQPREYQKVWRAFASEATEDYEQAQVH